MPALRILLALLVPGILAAQRVDSTIAIVGGTLIDGNGGPPVQVTRDS